MSRKKARGKLTSVLREARRRNLPMTDRNLLQKFQSEIGQINDKKTKRRIKMQSTLDEAKTVYDNTWVGDSMQNISCNGLINKNDVRGFQFEIASMADAGVNYFSFAETCINVNKPGYARKLQDSFSDIIPTGKMSFVNSPSYPKRSNYQPGGISGGFDGIVRTRYLSEGRDKLGR